MLPTLRDAVPKIIAGLVIATITVVITTLEPGWRVLAWLSALAAGVVLLLVSVLVRRLWRARQRGVQEDEYLRSVVSKYRIWTQRYLDLDMVAEGFDLDLAEDMTIHPAMYMLVEKQDARPEPDSPASERRREKAEVNLFEVLDRFDQVALLGEPGSGKTTQLQWVALHLGRVATGSPRGRRPLPLLIELSRYTTQESVEQFVSRCLREDHGRGGEFLAQHLADYLGTGKLVFLFDGLNEMPADGYRDRVDRLRTFAGRWLRNKFIFTCRVLDYEYRFGWPRVVITPLEEAQVEEYVTKYLPETGTQLMQELRAGDRALLDLARNPFMLRMMTLVHQRRGALPAARGRLLSEFVRALLARERGDSWLNTAEAEAFLGGLAQLAFVMIQRGEVGTTVDLDWVENALGSAPSAQDGASTFTVAELLKLAADANLLEVSQRQERVRYYHELLQEYFAALLLQRQYARGEDLVFLFGDYRWEQTASMVCGLVDRPDRLVVAILEGLGPERGALLAGACCAEAIAVLRQETVDQVVGSLQALAGAGIGPLGIKAMDLIARIDYTRVEDMVLEPLPDAAQPRELQTVLLLGAKYTHIVPIYMGPFYWATRDRAWEPRAYAASLVRTLGSPRIGEALLATLKSPVQAPGLEEMITAVLADMRYSQAADAFVGILAEGSHTERIHAARGLGRIVADEAEALLTKSLLDSTEGPGLREACAFALAEIGGVELVESLVHGTSDTELQGIACQVLSQLQPSTGQSGPSWPDDTQVEVDALRELEPTELLGRLVAAYEEWGSNTYPLAAALALRADEGFIPQLEATMQALQRPVEYYYPHGEYKLREALWWTIDAIRERQRRGGRPSRLSASPRDWSAFGAPAR